MSDGRLHVLVVDDSAVVRQTMRTVLASDPTLTVETANDPIIAKQKMARRRPDVILLDLVMPRVDGLTFLQEVMETDPIPVVVYSGHVGELSVRAIMALERGAVEIIPKPTQGLQAFAAEEVVRLRETLKTSARARLPGRRPRGGTAIDATGAAPAGAAETRPRTLAGLSVAVRRLVVVGASTGGTQALATLLAAMPEGAPPILIVQHMPAGFTRAFANRLDECSLMEVREAAAGDEIRPGLALVAPGGLHLTVGRRQGRLEARLQTGPPVSGHRPSVDVLFRSVARLVGADAVGILLTGMGADGAEGLLEMRHAGAHTIAQDEATSVIFGMPKEAIRLGAAEAVLPLDRIADQALKRSCAYRPDAGEGRPHPSPRG